MAGVQEKPVEGEVLKLKEKYLGQCIVISGVGEFSHVVNFLPEGTNISLKLQVPERYPSESPTIMIRSSTITDNEKGDALQELESVSKSGLGSPSLENIIERFLQWIKDSGIDVTEKNTPTKSKKKSKKSRTKNKESLIDDSNDDAKKPSMKTAIDVIKRIQWDSSLQSDDFLVGYIDRFCGIQEKYFSAFSWEDIASVDYNVLAVPKHRIQYFKYKDVVVWDKVKRFDHVFGSNGGNKTITDVIAEYEADLVKGIAEKVSCSDGAYTHAANTDDDDDSDDDSDDGINVICNATAFSAANLGDDDDDDDITMDTKAMMDKEDSRWQNKLRPNHFVALRITNESIKQSIKEVQNHITKYEPRYKECCIPQGALHITLCMLGLDTTEQIANAVQALQKVKSELKAMVPKDKFLKLEGVSNFYDRVVYAKADPSKQFLEFVDHLKLCLTENGVIIRDGYDFVPHCTIMKVTRPVARQMGKKTIDQFLYQSFHDKRFGKQVVDRIHLCSICDSRQSDGFYLTATEIDLA